MGLHSLIANSLWYLSSLPESLAFQQACQDSAAAQQKILLNLLRRNAATEFGRRYDFASIRSIAEYQARVPLSTYEDYRQAIEQIGMGQAEVLTCAPVLLLEPTSGSTAATKYIPYTAGLKAEFQHALAPWVVDLFSHQPALLRGPAYWSVTPVTRRNERTPAGIPIGFEDDSNYLGGWQRHLIQAVMAVPPAVRLVENMETFRYVTLLFLLRCRSLALISVWNPTFLVLLLEKLQQWWPSLAADIAAGTLSPPSPLPADLQGHFLSLSRPLPRRAAEIERIFPKTTNYQALWPHLGLISCWAEAQAARHVPELARLFPQARIQGKGLIATEGFVSFPLTGQPGAALALRSHFFEFLPAESPSSNPLLAHQLLLNQHYSVVITTGGGLYRYQLNDLVQVNGFLETCPLLRFMGKEAYVSDWFGEKLNERHVRQVLDELLAQYGLQPGLAMLACDEQAGVYAYTLFIEVTRVDDSRLWRLGQELETALQENYHYRYCRDLGQLDSVRVFRVEGGGLETYLSVCQAHGQRAGDIKPTALHRLGGWSQAFKGKLVHPS